MGRVDTMATASHPISVTEEPTHAVDLQLVRRVKRGDRAALEEFVGRMRIVSGILSVRNARMGRPLDDEDLLDLTQDALVVIWRKLASFEGTGSLEGWAYKVASLELLNAVRKKQRGPRTSASDAEEPWYPAEVSPSESEEAKTVLRHLAPREAEIVRLKHFEQLSFPEIAELLELSPSTAKTHYYRGVEKLRVVLEKKEQET